MSETSNGSLPAASTPASTTDSPRHSSASAVAPSAKAAKSPGKPSVWRSLAEFKGELEPSGEATETTVASYVDREFPTDDFDRLEGVDRRRFFQILGASAALAGASSCRWEKESILPYTNRPEDMIPGKLKHFASVLDLAGAARPVMVSAFDFRPIKVEPNRLVSPGTDVFSQGEILGFYDPDRSRRVVHKAYEEDTSPTKGERPGWSDALEALQAKKDEGGFAVLASTHSSPTLHRLAQEMQGSGAKWTWWSPVARDGAMRGSEMAFGQPARAVYSLENADVVVSFDCDFQRQHPDSVRMSGDFAKRRMPEDGNMSRLYAVESRFTSTGVTSDHRLPVRSVDVGAVLQLLAEELGAGAGKNARAQELEKTDKVKAFVAAAARDIRAVNGRAILLPGDSQPAEVHALAHRVNETLGAIGKTVEYVDEPLAGATTDALAQLVADMRSGAVKTLLIIGGNPAYDAPADLDFAAAMASVTTAHLSLYRDETSRLADWHLPMAHWLESWGDARSWTGSVHIGQPLIKPIHGGKTAIEICAQLLGRDGDALQEVRATFDALGGDASETRWRKAVHDGVIEGSSLASVGGGAGGAAPEIVAGAAGTEVTFFPCTKVFDGRFANNGWLQELPDFTTKMTWDNAALIGVATANDLGVDTGDMVKIDVDGRSIEAAVYVAPGQAEDSVAIALGYGRDHGGLVAGSAKAKVEAAGFNAYPIRTTAAMDVAAAATVAKTSGSYEFATTQEHHLIDKIGMQGRRERLHKLVMEGTEEEWKEDPHFPEHTYHVPKLESLFEQKEYDGTHQWGMTIDLSTCNGCNACVISCQAENNIPIVGKEQVKRGREMHWMRVDLYYQGDAEDASTMDAVNQPINCLQCENAPCEQVCPVAATVHSAEGTNDMVYNRCIGTRYCGNNCPVKVRRFNYFHYTKYMDEPEHKLLQLGQNPNVTVRSRGVMEKCTYCVQRISEARITARNEGRKIRDGEVVTACQASCPTEAIHFGDLTDPEAVVTKKQALGRDYSMLAELNLKPRTQYLARISNPNTDLSKVMPQGVKAREDYDPHIYEPHHGGHGHAGGHGDDHGTVGGESHGGDAAGHEGGDH